MRNSDELRNRAEQVRQSISRRCPDRPPPAENGRRIGTIERSADEQIRVNWSECEGHFYVNVRIWKCDRSGQWWPDGKRGLSVRIRELPSFAAAIADCLDLVEADRQRRQENQAHEPGEFDEFATG